MSEFGHTPRVKGREMSKLDYSRIPITEMIFALPADTWQVRLVPDDDHNAFPVLSPTYTTCQLINAVGFLRLKNMEGYHIYGRPDALRHVLVDDLDEDAIHQLGIDGLRPALGVRTSKGNYQARITLSEDEIEPNIAKAAARILAQRYNGDLGSADAYHVGRLPGFTNRKGIYWTERGYPFTGLYGQVFRGVAPGAAKLLAEAEELAASLPSSLPYTYGACVPITNIAIDPSRSPMTPIEAHEIYEAELKCQAERKGWNMPIQQGFRSDADYAVIYSLWKYYGFDPDDLAAVLQYESEKAAERGMDYVIRTVSNVCHLNNQSTHSL
jgi:hypothetical protein